jgi:hypothetical protein
MVRMNHEEEGRVWEARENIGVPPQDKAMPREIQSSGRYWIPPGNPAIPLSRDQWLCVPPLRMVCLYQVEFIDTKYSFIHIFIYNIDKTTATL